MAARAWLDGGEGVSVGAVRVMATDALLEWRLARASGPFQPWLARGAVGRREGWSRAVPLGGQVIGRASAA